MISKWNPNKARRSGDAYPDFQSATPNPPALSGGLGIDYTHDCVERHCMSTLDPAVVTTFYSRHALAIRILHWVNAITFFVLFMSGLNPTVGKIKLIYLDRVVLVKRLSSPVAYVSAHRPTLMPG